VIAVADFYKNSNLLIGTKNRINSVTLVATDADWKHGSGPEASGPLIALVLAMTGRTAALDDLAGVRPATATAAVERVDVLGGLIHEYRHAA
jgi:hypothetical protein